MNTTKWTRKRSLGQSIAHFSKAFLVPVQAMPSIRVIKWVLNLDRMQHSIKQLKPIE